MLELLARGRTLKVVAERLTISKGTAGTHIANIYRKCDVHAQQDLIDLFEKFAG
ncbi:MAG: LuxR C-terminal-related transcriptional regulator [Adlercreutzia sp.]|nr:LuxR C-terminal-related transcriptional regulator [Adlercreutzia sp.]